jgi:hypothetical protein
LLKAVARGLIFYSLGAWYNKATKYILAAGHLLNTVFYLLFCYPDNHCIKKPVCFIITAGIKLTGIVIVIICSYI